MLQNFICYLQSDGESILVRFDGSDAYYNNDIICTEMCNIAMDYLRNIFRCEIRYSDVFDFYGVDDNTLKITIYDDTKRCKALFKIFKTLKEIPGVEFIFRRI